MLKEVLNPFSEEALRIVKDAPPLHELPKSVFNMALGKISSEETGRFVLNQDDKEDIISFHLLLAAAAFRFGPYSKESRLVTEVIKKIISSRIGYQISNYAHEKNAYDEGLVTSIFSQFFDVAAIRDLSFAVEGLEDDLRHASASTNPEDTLVYGIPLFKILPALSSRRIRLTDLYLLNGYAFLSLHHLILLSELILESLLKNHLEKIPENKYDSEIPELKTLEDTISAMASNPDEYLKKLQKKIYFAVKPGAFRGQTIRGGKSLKPEFFPPCINLTLQGVSSGSRNYAITVLLTSFTSYARIAPIGSKKDARISDYIDDPKVLEEEVLPVIYEAAERCSPPLFADQPLEKVNILYHLGLGLSGEARFDQAGRSSWYFPPNCDKIRREAPALCRPDQHCKEIRNPLSYYAKRLFPKSGKGKAKRKTHERAPAVERGVAFRGKITQIYDGSGLIQRCPKCDRWIIDNFCIVHSDVEGVYDLRIKARFKDGNISHTLVLLRETTEKAIGISLEEAKKLGEKTVIEKIKNLVGKSLEIEGKKLNKNFIVRRIKEV